MLEAAAAMFRMGLYCGLGVSAGLALASVSLGAGAARPLRTWLLAAALLAALCAALTFLVLLARLDALGDPAVAQAILTSPSGVAMILQIAGATGMALFAGAPAPVAAASAVIALASLAVNGHAAAEGPVSSILILLHVALASWWIGALLVLRRSCAHDEPSTLAGLLRTFTRQATVIVLALIAAGIVVLGYILGFDPDRILSQYGAVFASKVGLVGLALLIVLVNRFRHAPLIAAGDPGAALSLRRSIGLELGAILGVLAATAVLTTWTSPHA